MSQVASILIVLGGVVILGTGFRWWWKTSWVPLMRPSKNADNQSEHDDHSPE